MRTRTFQSFVSLLNAVDMIQRDVSEKYYLLGCDTMQISVHGYTRHNAMLCLPVNADRRVTYLLCPLQYCIPKIYCRGF